MTAERAETIGNAIKHGEAALAKADEALGELGGGGLMAAYETFTDAGRATGEMRGALAKVTGDDALSLTAINTDLETASHSFMLAALGADDARMAATYAMFGQGSSFQAAEGIGALGTAVREGGDARWIIQTAVDNLRPLLDDVPPPA